MRGRSRCRRYPRPELRQPCAIDQAGKVLQCEDLAPRRKQEFLHIFPAYLEAAPGDTGNNFEARRIIRGKALHAQAAKVLHSGNLIAGRAVILGYFSLNNDLRVELVRYDEIWRLIETGDALGSLGLASAYSGGVKRIGLDRKVFAV